MNNTLFEIIMLSGIFLTLVTILLLVTLFIKLIMRINKHKEFPRYTLRALLICGLLSSFFLVNWVYNPYFLPKGFMSQSIPSEDGQLEARVYNYSGFIDYKNVRVEIYNNKTQNSKTIYYNFVEGPLDMNWIDQDSIKIENKTLNVKTETYDFRRDKDK